VQLKWFQTSGKSPLSIITGSKIPLVLLILALGSHIIEKKGNVIPGSIEMRSYG
jgi:hypothetical protein